jgi:hypothetical protein
MMLISVENKYSGEINLVNPGSAYASAHRQVLKVVACLFYCSSPMHAVSTLNPGHYIFNRSLGVK